MTLFDSDFAPRERRRFTRRQKWGFGSIVLALVVALVFAFAPSPYVIEQPGPVFNTLGSSEDSNGQQVPLITIDGATSYDTTGELNMLTVSVVGNRENRLSWLVAGLAWFDGNKALLPIDAVFPNNETAEEQTQQNQALMVNSQQDAIAAALINLGYSVDRKVTVQGFSDGSPAANVLQVNDVIAQANGQSVQSVTQLRSIINGLGGAAVPLTIVRNGVSQQITVTPTTASDGSYVLGIGASVSYTFPIKVTIQLDNVGGPSAGMMFALGIITKLTPNGDLTGGKNWAGTGTIDADGNVGAIGGIAQKMAGARSAGADYMLAPTSNCDEVVGHIPSGLQVFAVSTLDQAKTAIETVASGSDTSQLPRCNAG